MEKFRELFKQYMYYGIISMLVIVALVFLPMLDTDGNLGFSKPSTTLGWIAYIVIRCLVGVIVFMIFISFDEQGKVNILNDPRYIEAYDKLFKAKDKNYIPMSPIAYKLKTRLLKGATLSITMIGTAFIIVEVALSYNYSILMAYGITIFMSVVTGLFQMIKSSTYWVEEFPKWVDYHIEQIEDKEKKNDTVIWKTVAQPTRASTEE